MRVIAVIDDKKIIKKILKHLDLWDVKNRPPPKIKGASQVWVKRDALKKLRKSINELIIVVSGATMETPMILGFARKFPCQCRPELTG